MLALVYALDEEVKPILKQTRNSLLLCRTGIGMGNAHEACERLIKESSPALILSVGYAGGLKSGIQTGELLLPTEVWSESGDRFSPDTAGSSRLAGLIEAAKLPCHTGPLLTVFNPLKRPAQKSAWGVRGAAGVDMETAAIAAVCQKKNVPFASLRVIFDPVEMELPVDEKGKVTWKGIFKIPQMIQMNRRCQRNLEKVVSSFIQTF